MTADLAEFLPATAELVAVAFVLALALAVLFALSGALRWRGAGIFRGVLLLAATAPPFLLALGGIVVFYSQLGWLPARPGRAIRARGRRASCWWTACCTAIRPRSPALLRTCCCPRSCWRSPRRSRSAGCCGPVCRPSWAPTTFGPPGLEGAHRDAGAPQPRRPQRDRPRRCRWRGLQLGFMFAGPWSSSSRSSAGPASATTWPRSIPVADFPAIAGVTLVLGAIYVLVQRRRRHPAGRRRSPAHTRDPTINAPRSATDEHPSITRTGVLRRAPSCAAVPLLAARRVLVVIRARPAPAPAAAATRRPTDGTLTVGLLGDIGQPPDPDIYYANNGTRDHDERLRGPGAVPERHRHGEDRAAARRRRGRSTRTTPSTRSPAQAASPSTTAPRSPPPPSRSPSTAASPSRAARRTWSQGVKSVATPDDVHRRRHVEGAATPRSWTTSRRRSARRWSRRPG